MILTRGWDLELIKLGQNKHRGGAMSKSVLIIVGILVLVMGVLGLFVVWFGVKDPVWHAVAKIVVGLIAIYVGATDKA